MGRSTAKVSPPFPAGLSWALRGGGEDPCAGTWGVMEAGEGMAQQLENFLTSQGLPVYPTNLSNLVLCRQGVPFGEDLLLCQPHLCFPSILCRLLRQELRSQGLWLRAGRRGTDPLPVSSRAGPVLAQGSSCAARPPHAAVSAPLSPPATAASAPAPPACPGTPQSRGVPALSPWGPAGAGGTGGVTPPTAARSCSALPVP